MNRPTPLLLCCVAALGIATLAPPARAVGLLIPSGRSGELLPPLAIESHRVEVRIRERAAETKVVQVFRNSTSQVLEATYVFPLPPSATVSGFAMWINGERRQGELLAADQARAVYEEIVRRMIDPGLVEYMGGNLFRARVFPIPANGTQQIEISFTEELSYDAGVLRFVYPLRTGGAAAQTLHDFTMTATVESRTPIRAVYSPTHSVSVSRRGDHHATLGFENLRASLDRDFELYYAVADGDVGLSVLGHRPARLGGDSPEQSSGHFLMMIAPRAEGIDREIIGKNVTFVVDTSGSMAGEKMERARAALLFCLSRLNGDDTFNVIRFSTDVEPLFERPAAASAANVERARAFVARMVAAGGTAIAPALARTLGDHAEGGAPHIVVFLTDGMPTVGETDPARIAAAVRESNAREGARLFVFGVGDDVNTNFLDLVASQNHGYGEYMRDGRALEQTMQGFWGRVSRPVLTNLRIEIAGIEAYDLFPRELGDLFAGSQILVFGRYRRGANQAQVTLTGSVGAESRRFAYPVRLPETEDDNAFIPRLWATRKVGYLLDQIRLNGENPELRQAVVQIGTEYGIVTPYTSYLVTDASAGPIEPVVSAGDRRRMMPTPSASPAAPPPAEISGGSRRSAMRAAPTPPSVRDLSEGFGASPAAAARPSGGGMPPAFEPPRPSAAPLPSQAQGIAAPAARGDQGRALSRGVRTMREASQDDQHVITRLVGRRVLLRQGTRWNDRDYRAGMQELRIRYGSPAYFALLRERPDLCEALAVGTELTLVVAPNRALVISAAAGEADVNLERLRTFCR